MLEFFEVTAGYGAAAALRGVSLTLARGEGVALLGRNGAGKSTLIKSAVNLVRATGGDIRLENRSLRGMAVHRIARLGLGYVPEERRVFADLTVAENLLAGRRAGGAAPAWTEDRVYSLFPNLAERRGQRAGTLSGGEQQMLSIARTLMGQPRYLLLDEPFEGLAPVIVEQLEGAILELRRAGLALLIADQNLHAVRALADRVCVLETGTVRFLGRVTDFEAAPEIAARYLGV